MQATARIQPPRDVNPSSLTFGRTGDEDSLDWYENRLRPNCKYRDVDHDRLLDLVCR